MLYQQQHTSQPPMATRAAPRSMLAPPSAAPIAPNSSSATVDDPKMEYRRMVWSWMNAAASSGMPAPSEKETADAIAACLQHHNGLRESCQNHQRQVYSWVQLFEDGLMDSVEHRFYALT
jgi:hypothetical protein